LFLSRTEFLSCSLVGELTRFQKILDDLTKIKSVIYFEYMIIQNTKLKVGIIGLGHQSLEDHIPSIKVSQDVELVGVVEIDKEKIKSFFKR